MLAESPVLAYHWAPAIAKLGESDEVLRACFAASSSPGRCFLVMSHPLESQLAASWPPDQWSNVTVLVAVSGGPDSVALLRGLQALRGEGPGQLVVAHFDHRWREESAEDAVFVEQLAGQLQLRYLCGKASGSEPQTEATAREQRYEFLVQSAREVGARYVALAHTADDQAETILHRIMRGTGIAGLAGIPRVRSLDHGIALMRPLLHCRRDIVIDYLQSLGQSWQTDASNQDLQYMRNRIRQQLLPQLQSEYQEGVQEALLRLGERAAEVQQVLDLLTSELMEQSVVCRQEDHQQRVQIDCQALANQQPHLVRELLVAIWKDQSWPRQAMGSQQWQRLAGMVLGNGFEEGALAVQSFPGCVEAKKEGESLWLTRPREKHS